MKVAAKITSVFFFIFFFWNLQSQNIVNPRAYTFSKHVTKKVFKFNPENKLYFTSNSLLTRTPAKLNLWSNYNFDNLAMFCKIEEKVAKKSNLHMRLRLGSLDYVNYLEQKPLTVLNY